jgi:hypothetical protein
LTAENINYSSDSAWNLADKHAIIDCSNENQTMECGTNPLVPYDSAMSSFFDNLLDKMHPPAPDNILPLDLSVNQAPKDDTSTSLTSNLLLHPINTSISAMGEKMNPIADTVDENAPTMFELVLDVVPAPLCMVQMDVDVPVPAPAPACMIAMNVDMAAVQHSTADKSYEIVDDLVETTVCDTNSPTGSCVIYQKACNYVKTLLKASGCADLPDLVELRNGSVRSATPESAANNFIALLAANVSDAAVLNLVSTPLRDEEEVVKPLFSGDEDDSGMGDDLMSEVTQNIDNFCDSVDGLTDSSEKSTFNGAVLQVRIYL